MNKNILIVEDEVLLANQIKRCIIKHGYNCVGTAISYEKAIVILESNSVDIVLLDINIFGEKTGIDLANTINTKYGSIIIYITSYSDQTTLEQLKPTLPKAYIPKPINETQLVTTLDIVCANANINKREYCKIKVGNSTYKFDLNELLYLVSDHIYVEVILKGQKKVILRIALKKLASLFPENVFVQANRSVYINPTNIDKIHINKIEIGDASIKISKSCQNNFSELFNF